MDKFCPYCGKELAEGVQCDCQQGQATQKASYSTANKQSNSASQQTEFVLFMKNIWALVKGFIKNPVKSVIAAVKNENFAAGLFFAGIQALVTALVVIILAKRVFGFLFDSSSFLSDFVEVDVPYLQIFLKVFITTAVQFFLLIGIIFVVCRVAVNNSCTFKVLISAVGLSTLSMTLSWVAALIIGSIVPSLFTVIISFGIVLSIILNYVAIRESYGLNEDKTAYILSVSYLLHFLIISLILEQVFDISLKSIF